jgi:uracil phosphoribosyltransferase
MAADGFTTKLSFNFIRKIMFMLFVLNHENTVGNQFLLELRDAGMQRDRARFRKNMERLGEIMAYELSKKLSYTTQEAVTPLGKKVINVIADRPVMITILRAGLPFFHGLLNFFDQADCGFIGAFRREDENHLTIKLEYAATPSLKDRLVILIDPMLATGRSVVDSVTAMLRNGKPSYLHIVSLVAAPEGIEHLKKNLTLPYSLWTCAVDEKLNHQFYIVPGLGDAGDLSFGEKL